MKTLGITGGIGSGKTTVCRLFEALGARVFFADDEAKRLMHREDVRHEIAEAFGAESYLPSGELNRSYLADRVFNRPRALRRISHIVHPRVFEAFEEEKDRAVQDGVPLLIKEAAILFESGGDRHVDAVAVVDAPVHIRVSRVMARDETTEEAIRARMQHQWDGEELRRRADFIIDNQGDENSLRAQVERIFNELTSGQ